MPIDNERKLAALNASPNRSLDRLLLDEVNHRVANEVSSALAALRLALSAKGQGSRLRMIDFAINRLEGFGECSRLLAGMTRADTDAGALVEQMCRSMMRSRVGPRPHRVLLDLPETIVDGEIARRVAMIAYELITNALAYAFPTPGGELEVRIEQIEQGLVLTIADDGPGLVGGNCAMPPGKRLGGKIVAEIVQKSRGRLECEAGPGGTTIHVTLPVRHDA